MNESQIMKIFADTAYVRTGGSPEELHCARYLQQQCADMGLEARLESFPVDMATIHQAQLLVDGVEISCKGYLCSGSGEVEAPLYYLRQNDPYALSRCQGKIVLVDGYMGYWMYQDILNHGAVGFITYDGNANYADSDIDQRELRGYVSKGRKIPGVSIHARDAIDLVRRRAATAKITLFQDEYPGESWNVVADLPGELSETIVISAHYDSTALSQGAYDNMSGSIGCLAIAEYFLTHPHRYSLQFVWHGSEERGLLGSKAYLQTHAEELNQLVLNINMDMIGCIMGKCSVCCTTEEALVSYVKYMGLELGYDLTCRQDIRSTDSTPFADCGIPAISFARYAPSNTATIHNRYDTMAVASGSQMAEDIAFIIAFTQRMACSVQCPVSRTIPDNLREKIDIYLNRKRANP